MSEAAQKSSFPMLSTLLKTGFPSLGLYSYLIIFCYLSCLYMLIHYYVITSNIPLSLYISGSAHYGHQIHSNSYGKEWDVG